MSKPRGRPFSPGNTFGRGRPKGSRNKAKAPGQQLLDQYSESLTRKCIAMALQGDQRALRICMERINPARQDACVQLSLPSIRTAQDDGGHAVGGPRRRCSSPGAAQIAALKGRSADLRAATEAHRQAIAEAAAQAVRIAQTAGVHPGADELTRTLVRQGVKHQHPDWDERQVEREVLRRFRLGAGIP